MIWERTDLFIFLKSLILGSFFWARSELKVKEFKIGSRIPITIEPLIQSYFKWISSIPVLLIGFSL